MTRVLIVEDSPTQAKQFALILEDAGFEVEIAPSAELGLLALGRRAFDLILSDLHLPGDSGFDLCRRLKSNPATARLPIVVCTSEADPVNVLRGLQVGADGFITKGRDPEAIVACLRRVLARHPASGPSAPTRVAFLGESFSLVAGREQLLDILLSAFEDVVHLNAQSQEAAAALRNRNRELKELADSEHRAHVELKKAESQLVQAEKLTALGLMVAGVAHEINNPLAFVSNNVAVLRRDAALLVQALNLYREAEPTLAEYQPALFVQVREFAEGVDLPYTLTNLESLMTRTADGLKRIQQIVKNLRDFARLDESDLKEVDLNVGIRSTFGIIRGRADEQQVRLLDELESLPEVTCYPTKINQVLLNLLSNAIDACRPGDSVTVRTRPGADGLGVEIEIADTGRGIPEAIRDKIFDPFFTTKPLGKGTGLGLSTSYGIVQSHGGRIEVASPGRGASFTIHLPIRPVFENA